MAGKSGFRAGMKNVRTAMMQDSVGKLKEEKTEKKPVNLVKALGLEELSSVNG